jgi:hypothetical protein
MNVSGEEGKVRTTRKQTVAATIHAVASLYYKGDQEADPQTQGDHQKAKKGSAELCRGELRAYCRIPECGSTQIDDNSMASYCNSVRV